MSEKLPKVRARAKGLAVVGMTGRKRGTMKGMCDHCLSLPSDMTSRIQEGHLATYHLLCWLVEAMLFGATHKKARA